MLLVEITACVLGGRCPVVFLPYDLSMLYVRRV
jgi:hypothetical protein